MIWTKGGAVCVCHQRASWTAGSDSTTIVHCNLSTLRGKNKHSLHETRKWTEKYNLEKYKFDIEAALDVVEKCISPDAVDRLAGIVAHTKKSVRLVTPRPEFDAENATGFQEMLHAPPANALPAAYAGYLCEVLGAEFDEEIIQAARVGRTKLARWMRFLCQPKFIGAVDVNATYIITDDVVTTGGTFAALRTHIVNNGGTVLTTTALAHKDGGDVPFRVARATIDVLLSQYGNGLKAFWAETFGHDIQCLTEAEAQFLVRWSRDRERDQGIVPGNPMLHRLRDRINQAAAKGD